VVNFVKKNLATLATSPRRRNYLVQIHQFVKKIH
jgi:hypothetical protein